MRVETPVTEPPPRGTWSDAPWTVKAFVVATVMGFVAWVVLTGLDKLPRAIFSLPLSAAICYGLVRGYRGAWVIGMLFAVLGVLGTMGYINSWRNGSPIEPEVVSSLAVWAVTAAMLLHPLTRLWVNRQIKQV